MIIGITGFKGSGKDTVGNYLEKNNFIKYSFAEPLKDITSIIFDWPRELLEGNTPESRYWREQVDTFWEEKLNIKNFTPRYALQYVGTEIIRKNLYNDIWLSLCEKKILNNKNRDIVVTDCRFKNELQLIEKYNGKIIHIKNNTEPFWYDTALKANMNDLEAISYLNYLNIHKSEYDFIGYPSDYVIINNSTLEKLYEQIDEIIFDL